MDKLSETAFHNARVWGSWAETSDEHCSKGHCYDTNITCKILKSYDRGYGSLCIKTHTRKEVGCLYVTIYIYIQNDTKKRELLKNPTKIEDVQEKKIIDRNWTITTCLL